MYVFIVRKGQQDGDEIMKNEVNLNGFRWILTYRWILFHNELKILYLYDSYEKEIQEKLKIKNKTWVFRLLRYMIGIFK